MGMVYLACRMRKPSLLNKSLMKCGEAREEGRTGLLSEEPWWSL